MGCRRLRALAGMLGLTALLLGAAPGPNASTLPAAPPRMPVGAASVDLSPRSPVRLMGYAARAQSPAPTNVAQRLHARALALGEGPEACVVVTLDNCILPTGVSETIRRRLGTECGLAADRIALTVTHTHSAPCLTGAAPNIFAQAIPPEDQAAIDAYTGFFIDSTVAAVREALARRRPARLAWGQGRADFARNRRTPGGPVDQAVPVLRATDDDGRLVAVLTSYSCHCTTLSGEFNASHGDWAGVAAASIEAGHPGAVGLVAIGCGADANPSPRGTLALAEQHGRSLAAEVERLIGLPLEPLHAPPTCRLETVEIPFQPHFTREQWRQRAGAAGIVGFHARRWLERLDRGEAPAPTLPYPVQTFSFSTNLGMVFLGGEVVVDYALRLKSELDPRRLWINGYANDVPGYIPSRRILKEGGYEAESSLWYYDRPQQFDPALEDRIVTEVHRHLGPTYRPPPARGEMIEPLAAHRALEAFQAPEGLTVDLVAGDDLVQSPVAIDFGADGRLWVCEMADYPSGLRGGMEPGGRIKVLTDTDGDGRMDRAEVVASGLPFPTGLMTWKDGILVCAAPDVRWIRRGPDASQAIDEVLLSGFATHNFQARVNGLRWGLDGWVHGAGGLFGGVIRSHRAGTETDARQRDFRFLPESGRFQALPGVSQQGRVRDDFGEWFGNDNGSLLWHFPLPADAAALGVEAVQARIPNDRDDTRVFPISRTLERFNDPHTANHLTSACAPEIFRDTALGLEYAGDAFVCEPVHNLVRRAKLARDGVSFAARRAPGEREREFLSSTDSWFRPVEVRTGTDGALWVVDLHRFVVEHPRWIPPERLRQLDVRAGADGGRIYRVRRRDMKPGPLPRLTGLPPEALAQRLGSANGPLRDLAHRELLGLPGAAWRRASNGVKALAGDGASPAVRAQALSLLASKGDLPEALLEAALRSEHPGLVGVALGLLPSGHATARWVDRIPASLQADPAIAFRRSLALARGDASSMEPLVRILADRPTDPWIRSAVLAAARRHPAAILKASAGHPALLRPTTGPIAAPPQGIPATRPTADLLPDLLAVWDAAGSAPTLESALALAERMAGQGGGDPTRLLPAWIAAESLTTSSPALVATRARWRRALTPGLAACLDRNDLPEPVRVAAARLWVNGLRENPAGYPELSGLMRRSSLPAVVRTALLGELRRSGQPAARDALLDGWSSLAPAERAERLGTLMGRTEWIPGLLSAFERNTVPMTDLSPAQRDLLRTHRDEAIRTRALRLFPASAAGMDPATEARRLAGAARLAGDAMRGRSLFAERCLACHAVRGQGHAVGPDLSVYGTKSFEDFLTALVHPDAAVDPRHAGQTVETTDGLEWTGVVTEATDQALTLRLPGGHRERLARSSIRRQTPLPRSLMPEGLTEGWTPQQVADLLAWIRNP